MGKGLRGWFDQHDTVNDRAGIFNTGLSEFLVRLNCWFMFSPSLSHYVTYPNIICIDLILLKEIGTVAGLDLVLRMLPVLMPTDDKVSFVVF